MNNLIQNPFFSIITPTYNRANFLHKTILSVINQTFKDWEYIIIDDASTDNTSEIINSFHDERIINIKNDINIERCASRNKGICSAKGKYICFLDSDDLFLKSHLEVLYENIREYDDPVAFFFTNSFNLNNGVITDRDCPDINKFDKFIYFLTYTVNPPRMCIHKNIFLDIKFDPQINICEDMDLELRIAAKYPVYQIQDRTVFYNIHPDSFTSGDKKKPFKESESYKKIFKKTELRGLLPYKNRNKLFSMVFFHQAISFESDKNFIKMYSSILRSFFLCPNGYNRKTNKILFVMFIYHIPLLGGLFKRLIKLIK